MLRYFCLKNTRHFKQKTDLVDFDGPNKKKTTTKSQYTLYTVDIMCFFRVLRLE